MTVELETAAETLLGFPMESVFVQVHLLVSRGVPGYIRSDNGPEFASRRIRRWLSELGTRTLFIERGSPWENGYIESFNGKLRDELLGREIFHTL